MKVYLDNAATTRLDPRVLAKMKPYFSEKYGNASSLHWQGQEAEKALKSAQKTISGLLNAPQEALVFTSGASESNNLIIKGYAWANKAKGKHLLISSIEHPCVIKAAFQLESHGFEIETIPVNKQGIVDLRALEKLIRKDTILVSVMAVNNEIGTIQPIKKIAQLAHKKGALFHVDAVQAVPYLDIDVKKWGVDFLSLSGHKFYGPKGIGLAYIKPGIKLEPLINGGGKEDNLRAGTKDIPSIMGLAEALKLAYAEKKKSVEKIQKLRDSLWTKIQKEIPEVKLNGSLVKRSPNNLNIMFYGVEGEAVLMDLSQKGICVSTGSACSASNLKSSYVLKALNLKEDYLNSNVRFSLGKFNNQYEVDYTVKELKKTVERLRSFSPIKITK